jgi:hypothetical protein
MRKKILLIEPDYQNKYPPIGLMKISTYHRLLGDHVRFFKGNVNDLVIEGKTKDCIKALKKVDRRYNWDNQYKAIYHCIKDRKIQTTKDFLKTLKSNCISKIEDTVQFHKNNRPSPQYDRVYVTSLFTFYWKVTIKAIEQAKALVEKKEDLLVGGVMASLLNKEIEEATGIKPHNGLLDKPGILDHGNTHNIDDLPLDYSLLHEIDYEYPTQSAYFTFMTKGCTRKCAFCSVPILEPTYKEKIPTLNKFDAIKEKFGEQRNLLLMDNNVLASPKFPEIAEDIMKMGFYKGAKYLEPNLYEIAIKNLRERTNDKAYVRQISKLFNEFVRSRVRNDEKEQFKKILDRYKLTDSDSITKENILKSYELVSPIYEKYRKKGLLERYVDFNQGVDGRYVTEENMKLLSQLNIRPLRIAFDYIGMKKQYINAVELAAKYGLKNLSNYILYNFKDAPDDLYERLRINIDLNKQYDLRIFSFPMKYIPLFGEDAKDRKYIGIKWNKKFVRAVQSILNVTKGIVAPGLDFFEIAFGKSIDEYREILYMPEPMIIYRNKFIEAGLTQEWRDCFNALNPDELIEAKAIIEKNDFEDITLKSKNTRIQMLLQYYTVNTKEVDRNDIIRNKLRTKFNKLIKRDMFIDLTLTYDYDRKYRKPKSLDAVAI